MSPKYFSVVASALFVFGSFTALLAQEPTTTTALPTMTKTQVQTDTRTPVFLTFVPIHRGIGPSPDANFGCSIPYPAVSDNSTTRTATWSGQISCNITVGLYGTTVLFNYYTNGIVGYGNQINTTAPSASSYGSYAGLPNGTYEVNFNVDITPPAGYTTNVGAGCSYINGGPRVHCTVGSGAFSQP